ncbi:hypothetical protein H5410_004796 [Solanum commersonii]|uniref:Uncharacterized protein n=1 Tax=Solanum commersonii TaxID=4109 RepID=A0A9J6A5C6_SOLCO|nr:hypothetical protein H5410_004796 [Solanum commersonii]
MERSNTFTRARGSSRFNTYKIEDLNINTITSDNVIELLKEVIDNNFREKNIQLAVNNTACSSKTSEKQKNDFEYEYSTPYTLAKINNRLHKQTISTSSKNEIENLKNEIKSIKQNQMISDHRLTKLETVNNKGKNIVEENTLAQPFNLDHRQGPSGSSYRSSSSNSPIIQRGGKSLVNPKTSQNEASSIHLEDIPENNSLYAQLQAYLWQKQSDTFSSIAKEDVDDIKSYEKISKKEMIFLLENSDIQRKEEPWMIFQQYLVNGLYFLGYNTSENVYNFSKMIIKSIISVEDWGISTMKERHISLNKVSMNFTYWDYIHAFDKVLIYNRPIPNWFLNWWSYHGPTIKNLPDPFLKLYKEWVKVSPNLNELYNTDHIYYLDKIDQIYFFMEFSVPWIHK